MTHRFTQRTVSLSLSALLTLALLGGIDHLAVADTPAAGMASHVVAAPRA